MPEHSPEPWKQGDDDGVDHITDANKETVCGGWEDDYHQPSTRDRRRIVAAVNACKGIPTEWLEKYGQKALTRRVVFVPEALKNEMPDALLPPPTHEENILQFENCPKCGEKYAVYLPDERSP